MKPTQESASELIAPEPRPPYSHLYSALNKLSPWESEMVQEKYIDGRTFEEISRKYKISRGRVESIVHRALMKLRHPRYIRLIATYTATYNALITY